MLEKGHRQSGLPDSYEGDILTTFERNTVTSECTIDICIKLKVNSLKKEANTIGGGWVGC